MHLVPRAGCQFVQPLMNFLAMRTLILSVLLTVIAATACAQRERAEEPGVTSRMALTVGSLERHYLLHVPSKPSGALLLAFHGGGESAPNLERVTGLSALSDREGFFVAYPEGYERSWADGRGTTRADRTGLDDVAFARAIVADVARTRSVDMRRVFATGPSNGGLMVGRLACDAADLFAGVAPVIATLAPAIANRCRPAASISVIGIQGVADPVLPFGGGGVGGTLEGSAAGGNILAGRVAQDLFRGLDGCAPTPSVTELRAQVPDSTSVTRREYTGCRDGTIVVWYEIAGGGHRWPPSLAGRVLERSVRRKLGVSSQNIDATAVIWSELSAHPRATPPASR